jgi:ribosomal protein L31
MTEEVKTMSEVEEVKVETTDDGEPDYKSLYEETQAKLEKASKFESRFKKTAKELNELKSRDNEP